MVSAQRMTEGQRVKNTKGEILFVEQVLGKGLILATEKEYKQKLTGYGLYQVIYIPEEALVYYEEVP